MSYVDTSLRRRSAPPRVARFGARLLAVVLLLYLALVAAVTLFQRQLMYHPDPALVAPHVAGLPIQEAIGNVSRDIKDPVGGIFKRAQTEIQVGVPLETALWRVAKTVRTDEFNFLIVALSIQRETGGNLAETLANLSQLLRARQQLRLKIRAFTSEARATMLIMTGLPFLVGGGMFIISPGYISPLLTTSTGQMVAAAAGCSMALGVFIMNKIATIKV